MYIKTLCFSKACFNNRIKITKTKIAKSINGNVTKVPILLDLFT